MMEAELIIYILIGLGITLTGSVILNVIQRHTINKLRESSEILIKDAYFNPLTSLPNEANFDIVLQEQIDRAKRHEKTFWLVYIKLKYYEQEDDIVNAANKLSKYIRDEDVLAHINTDEFVILFNEYLAQENYNIVLERLIASFPKYSIKLGKSTYPSDGEDKKYLLRSAKEDAIK